MRFYVYEIERDGEVIYVGKGCGKRHLQSAKERGGAAVIVAYFMTEAAALDFERERIAERLRDGKRLLNVLMGNRMPWNRRTDTQEMAREVLQWVAARAGRWIKAGRVEELASRLSIPSADIVSLHQRFGG